jgi:hypothetical protein
MPNSPAPLVDRIPDFFISDRLEAFAASNSTPGLAHAVDGPTHTFQRPVPLWNYASDGLVVARNHNLFTAGDAFQEFPKPGFRFECSYGTHDPSRGEYD